MGIIVKTRLTAAVKDYSKKKGYSVNSVSDDVLPQLNKKVTNLVEEAVERAHANNRRTVMQKDL
jgi:histone H3/H4